MKPRPAHRYLVLALCLLAICVAQVFGSKSAYYCPCSGFLVSPQISHCDGPHGEECHTGIEQAHDHGSEEQLPDRKDHLAVDQEIKVALQKGPAQWVQPHVLLAVLSPFPAELATRLGMQPAAQYLRAPAESPPSGVTVARTIVLLI